MNGKTAKIIRKIVALDRKEGTETFRRDLYQHWSSLDHYSKKKLKKSWKKRINGPVV